MTATPVYSVDLLYSVRIFLEKELLARSSEPAMVLLGFYWTLSANTKEGAEIAKLAIERKNIFQFGYIVFAMKAGETLVTLVSS
jgi:hypothetical protein